MLIHPVILCGGGGTRLWPRSRKQSAQVALMALHSAEPKHVPLKSAKRVKTIKNQKPPASH